MIAIVLGKMCIRDSSRSHVLPLIIFAVFPGSTVSAMGDEGKPIAEGLTKIASVFYKMIGILMKAAPIGLAAYFADLTGTYGDVYKRQVVYLRLHI